MCVGHPDLPRFPQVLLAILAHVICGIAICCLKMMAVTEPLSFLSLDMDETFPAPQELPVCWQKLSGLSQALLSSP